MINWWACCGITSLLNLDTTSFLQSSLSRPSVVALICGSICGYPWESFISGLLLEFVILDLPPIGGMPVPNGCIGAGISALLIPKCGLYYSFFLGLVGAILYAYVEKLLRSKRGFLNTMAERLIDSYKFTFGWLILIPMVIESVVSFFYLAIFYLIFSKLYLLLPLFTTRYINEALRLSFVSVVFVVMISLFFKFLTQVKKNA